MMKASKIAIVGAGMVGLAMPSAAMADVVIGPRVSYYFDNSNVRATSLEDGDLDGPVVDQQATMLLRDAFGGDAILLERDEGSGVLADQVGFAMFGGMINVGGDRDRVTFAAMYGEGNGSLAETNATSRRLMVGDLDITDVGTFSAVGDLETKRYDVELTWQRRTSETFALFAGARYERLETSGDITLRSVLTNNIDQVLLEAAAIVGGNGPPVQPPAPPVQSMAKQSSKLETFSVRGGATASVPFSENAVAFFNGMLHLSHQPDSSSVTRFLAMDNSIRNTRRENVQGETSFGPDFAVGAQITLAPNIALDMRYRAILFFPISGAQSFSDARVNHGVNVGVSFRL